MSIKDQIGRELTLDGYPKRIVSLVPSQTELLVDLGLEHNIVGITKFCVHPQHLLSEKTVIGGTKTISFKKIKSLQPDLIIANKEENVKDMIYELEEIAPVYVSDINSIEDSLYLISDIGILCNVEKNARELGNAIKKAVSDFKKFMSNISSKKVAYFIWHKPWMVTGGNNYINEILNLNKFENIFEGANRYPEVYIEYLSDLKPELLLLSSEPYPFKKEHVEELQKYTNGKCVFVDGELFCWYGSRILKAITYFKKLHLQLN